MYNERFVWDRDKYELNLLKHGVSFEEASTVFNDDNAVYLDDEAHSYDEERFVVIGFSENAKLLMVCHCYRNGDSLIRIISARKAEKFEQAQYERGW